MHESHTAYKDVSLAVALAESVAVPTKLLQHCKDEMAIALERPSWDVQDMSQMHREQQQPLRPTCPLLTRDLEEYLLQLAVAS